MLKPGAVLLELLLAGCLGWAQTPSRNIADRFPESEDKETVTSTCSACHTLARVAANNRDKAQWIQTVKAHESRGLKLDPDETDVIVRYLSAYFGPKVFLNTATADEFSALPGVGGKLAESIVRYREQHGPFKNMEDVIGLLGADTFAQVRNRLSIGTAGK
jgi:competence ComEA-like helix-hairpin-helix protein